MLESTIRVLNAMKAAGVVEDYAIGGAIGALFYMEPIETHDLDIFVALPESESGLLTLEGVYNYLRRRGCVPDGEHVMVEGVAVQILVPATSLQAEALEQAALRSYGGEEVKVMTAEHLVAIMAELNRPKDRVRIALFLEQYDVDGEKLHEILTRHGLGKKWKRLSREIGFDRP